MRFKTYLQKEPKHSDLVSCVSWYTAEEVFSAGDDHQLLKWNLTTGNAAKVTDLPSEIFPTDMHWFPRLSSKKQVGSDFCVLTSTDGRFHLLSKLGRIERSVDAHRGAVLAGRWSHDGTALATCGEDGQVKIWSRSGMLRSTLASNNVPVYSIAWSPNSDKVLFTLGSHLVIKPLQPNSKPLQWKAHEALILKVAWNPNNRNIISGGEDRKYKVWDTYGRALFSSAAMDFPVTSLAWTPDGELFAVGSFNTLRLCDKTGWSYSLDKPETQSILSISWSNDGTQVAGACGNARILFAHIIERRLEWKNFEVTLKGRKSVVVRNVTNEVTESLDFRDNIIKTSFCHGHLIVLTSHQLTIYSINNWNTPQISDLKEGNVSLVVQSEKYFLLVDGVSVYLYAYDGKVVSSPKWPGMRPDLLNACNLSLSNDTLAIRDTTDQKVVFLFETGSGKLLGDGKPFIHKCEILDICLDQCGLPNERKLAFIDKNSDLYLVPARSSSATHKLGGMVQSMKWNDAANLLATVHEGGRLVIWYYPSVVYVDPSLLSRTTSEKKQGEFGRNPGIQSFVGNHVVLRRVDGSQVSVCVSPYVSVLHSYIFSSQWDDALRLCRLVKDQALWGCLAAMATAAHNLNAAEAAYAALQEVDKVLNIWMIRGLPLKVLQEAEMSLMCGNSREAESTLLQASMPFHAVLNNIHLFNWERALNLALRNNCMPDVVISLRRKYLDKFNMKETNKSFLQQASVDLEDAEERIKEQLEKERNSHAGR